MSKTKKRQKQKDFQKKKLKVGKKLKSSNETLPHVRVGHIQIRRQFQPESNDQDTKKLPKTKDLLRQTQHKDALVRYEAVKKLHELYSTHTDEYFLCNYIYRFLDVIPVLFIDEDSGVRSAARRFLSWIFSTKEFNEVYDPGDPDLNLLLPYLTLAMNHSREQIKMDSLNLLDVYMSCPRLIMYGTEGILKNFLVLVMSEQHSQLGASGAVSRKSGGSLLSNPESKLSQQKWRASVLERLGKIFQILCDEICTSESGRHEVTIYAGYKCVESLMITDEMIQMLTNNLIPLLFECWLETGIMKSGEQMMSQTSVSVLQHVLRILRCIVCIMTKLEKPEKVFAYPNVSYTDPTFLSMLEKKCVQHFLSGFPFKISMRTSKAEEFKSITTSVNASICYIVSQLLSVKLCQCVDTVSDSVHKMADFVAEALQKSPPLMNDDMRNIIKNMLTYFSHLVSDEGLSEQIVSASLQLISGRIPRTEQERKWFKLCCMLLTPNLLSRIWLKLCTFASVQEWYASLPDLYLAMGKEMHEDISLLRMVLNCLITEKTVQCLRDNFTKNLPLYLDESFLSQLKSRSLPDSPSFTYFSDFLSFIRFANEVNMTNLTRMVQLALSGTIPPEQFSCFWNAIAEGFCQPTPDSSDTQTAHVDYEGFRKLQMNIIFAGFHTDIEAIHKKNQSLRQNNDWIHVDCEDISEDGVLIDWKRQDELVQYIMGTISILPDNRQRLQEVVTCIRSMLMTFRSYGFINACSIGNAIYHLPKIRERESVKDVAGDVEEIVCDQAADLLLGLFPCVNVQMNDKTVDEYIAIQPAFEVIEKNLTRYPTITQGILQRIQNFIADRKYSYSVMSKFVNPFKLLVRDRKMHPLVKERIEKLIQDFHKNYEE